MRLTPQEQRAITDTIRAADPSAQVYLFGSRVDDHARGGDIDLLILSSTIDPTMKRRIKLRLYDQLGEQKIDLLVTRDRSQPFVRMAIAEGVALPS